MAVSFGHLEVGRRCNILNKERNPRNYKERSDFRKRLN